VDDDHRAFRVGDAVLADRADERPDETAVTAAADDQQVGAFSHVQDRLGGVAAHGVGFDHHRRVALSRLADGSIQRHPRGLVELLTAGKHHHAGSVHGGHFPRLDGLDLRPGEIGLPEGPGQRLDRGRGAVDTDDDPLLRLS